jgi:hypothetical protein
VGTDAGGEPRGRNRGQGDRAQRTLLRKRRRSLLMIGGAVVAVAAIVVSLFVFRSKPQATVIPNDFVTTFQPGELQLVPDACSIVPAATVQEYLPGKVKVASPLPVNGKLGSGCNWQVDKAPVYRLLELNLLAYAPNGLVGNGSATDAAIDAYAATLQNLQDPSKKSFAAKAKVTMLSGLGNQAFSAVQVFKAGGAVTDVATVVIRYHNVIVTAALSGLDRSNVGSYGPVDKSELSAAAQAFAQAGAAALH